MKTADVKVGGQLVLGAGRVKPSYDMRRTPVVTVVRVVTEKEPLHIAASHGRFSSYYSGMAVTKGFLVEGDDATYKASARVLKDGVELLKTLPRDNWQETCAEPRLYWLSLQDVGSAQTLATVDGWCAEKDAREKEQREASARRDALRKAGEEKGRLAVGALADYGIDAKAHVDSTTGELTIQVRRDMVDVLLARLAH